MLPARSSESRPGLFGKRLLNDPHIVVRLWTPMSHNLSGIPHSDHKNSSGTLSFKEY